MSARATVSLNAASASGVVTASQNAAKPSSAPRQTTAAERDQHEQAEVHGGQPDSDHRARSFERADGPLRLPAEHGGPAAAGRLSVVRVTSSATDTPMFDSMSAMMLPFGSKNFFVTSGQPPRSSMVNRPAGVGKSYGLSTPATTGR